MSTTPTNGQAELLEARAQAFLQVGRHGDAARCYRAVVQADPTRAEAWYNLGYLLQGGRAFEEALSCYARAAELGMPGAEEALSNRGLILAQHLNRGVEAQTEWEAALKVNPRHVPSLVNLGNLHEQNGARSAALACYTAALAIDPNHALALSRLPNVASVAAPSDPIVLRLKAALARPELGDTDRADLAFALGKALDGCRAYEQAFAAYTEANEASRRIARRRSVRYDRPAAEAHVDALMRAFPGQVPEVEAAAESDREVVFICGLFRSGTSLVEAILSSHSQVVAGGELDLLPTIARQVVGTGLRRQLTSEHWAAMRRDYMAGLAARCPQGRLVTDKRPDNFLHIGLIKQLFPKAKIICTRRHPLDNCLALYFLHLDHAMPYALDLLDAGHWLQQHDRLMAHWKGLYGDDIHVVDYDALVGEPRRVVQGLLAHLGLPWEEACLEFHTRERVVRTASNWQVRRPLYTSSSGRWRHYERHLTQLIAMVGGAAATRLPDAITSAPSGSPRPTESPRR